MIIPIIVGVLLVVLDQVLKYLAVLNLKGSPEITLIPHVLGLCYVENPGAAWGIFSGKISFLSILTAILLLLIVWALFFSDYIKTPLSRWAAILFLAGGLGNLIDRILVGYVVDYIRFLFINFPVFNLADMCVVGGFILFMIELFIVEPKKNKQKKEASQ